MKDVGTSIAVYDSLVSRPSLLHLNDRLELQSYFLIAICRSLCLLEDNADHAVECLNTHYTTITNSLDIEPHSSNF